MKPFLMALGLALLPLGGPQAFAMKDQDPSPRKEPEAKKIEPATDVTVGLGFHGPTRFTASATVMRGEPKMLGAFAPAKLAQVRVGMRGAQLGLGLVAGVFEDSPFKPSGVAVTLKAIALRTWREPAGVVSGQTYAGLESDVVLLGFRGSIGYARRVSGKGGPDGRWVWSLGLGL